MATEGTPSSELRTDVLYGRCVIVAPQRAARPHDVFDAPERPVHPADCPFCDTKLANVSFLHESFLPGGEAVRVVPNAFPALSREEHSGAYGAQEVMIEARAHDTELADLPIQHIVEVLRVFASRTEILSQDPNIAYVLAFKNQGGKAGASLQHPHSQIFATGFLPPRIEERLRMFRAYRVEHGVCATCELVERGEYGPRHIRTDGDIVTLAPYASAYAYEAWLVPRRHVDNLSLLTEAELFSLAEGLKAVLSVLNQHGLSYNFSLQQAVDDPEEHFMLRIAPRANALAGVELVTHMAINSVPPENVPAFYRTT